MNRYKRAENILLFLLFFLPASVISKTYFNITPACIEAQKLISQLKLKQASLLLKSEAIHQPENCAIDYIENYLDYYSCLTSQDINELHKLEKEKSSRISRYQSLPDNSPYKLFAQAETELQWAFSRVFHQEFFTAALEIRNSYKLIEENTSKFPSFYLNLKNSGLLKGLLGNVPENFKWVLQLVGMKGNTAEGIEELNRFVENYSSSPELILDRQIAINYYILLQMNFGDKQMSWNYCEKNTRDFKSNLLSNYMRSFVAIKTGHNEFAIESLSSKPETAEYANFPYLDYLYGVALLNKLSDQAPIQFKKFITFSKGQNLIKDAYKRLSWYSLINGDQDKFIIYQAMVLKYGISSAEEDKAALKDAEMRLIPNISLLRSRLLFDGGYYDRALTEAMHAQTISQPDKMEQAYRTGRIYFETKQFNKAIEQFTWCIQNDIPELNLHFAPTSCTQIATIYEIQGNRNKAIEYYKKALTYSHYQYRNSNVTKAKQGLARLRYN